MTDEAPADENAAAALEDNQVVRDNPYAALGPEELAEVARLAQERTREQWAKEEAEKRVVLPPEPESVAEIQARLARQQEAEREREEREQALAAERQRWQAERMEERRLERIAAWDAKVTSLYPKFAKATIPSLDPPVAQEIRGWLRREHPGTLILLGDTGAGKTHAAFAAQREAYIAGKKCRFWPVPNLLDVMRPGKEGDKHFQDARTVDVLTLDDIGAEKRSDWTGERLYIVVNDRWMGQKATIVTSNMDLAGLKEDLGPRMYSRLRDDATVIQIHGRDRRLKK